MVTFTIRSSLLVVAQMVFASDAFPHMADDLSPQSLLTKRVEKPTPKASSGFDLNAVEGVVDEFRLWQAGSVLHACFVNGNSDLKNLFVETSTAITDIANLKFDFGKTPGYRTCDGGAYHIRVAFDPEAGNWSYIGTDSIRVGSDKPSLNIGYGADSEFTLVDKSRLKGVILHELGHAIALQHEHQSPEAKCDAEFNWTKIYESFKTNYGWNKEKVDQNLRMLSASPRLRTTAYDKSSIMHYYFPAWMYNSGYKSKCFVHENVQLSKVDKTTIASMYPSSSTAQLNLIKEKSDFASTVLQKILSTDEQKKWAKDLIDQAGSTAAPGFVFNYSSTHDGSEDTNVGQCAGAHIQVTSGGQSTSTVCSK